MDVFCVDCQALAKTVLNTKLSLIPRLFLIMVQSLLLCILESMNDHSRQISKDKFLQNMPASARHRRDRRIPRISLQHPTYSPFMILYLSGNDQALITLTGFDHRSFRYILTKFKKLYDDYSPYSASGLIRKLKRKARRPRSMTALQCLVIVLAWGRTRGSTMVLSMIFGVTSSVCSLFIRFGRRLLLRSLKKDANASIRMPNQQEISAFQNAFMSRYSTLKDVYAVADGLKLYLESSSECTMQNMFYNGWTHDHYVSNIFVLAPNGCVIACALNAPGSMHDSSIAEWGNVYTKLEDSHIKYGGICVVDSAFCRGQYPFLNKSSQDPFIDSENAEDVIRYQQATSARQASEWGMRALQGSFPRLKDRMIYEERGERKLILVSMVRLFNIRARLVGINQIQSVYMPHLEREANHILRQH